MNLTENATITAGLRTDHSLTSLKFKTFIPRKEGLVFRN